MWCELIYLQLISGQERKGKQQWLGPGPDLKCNTRTVSASGHVVREPKMVSTSCGSFEEVHQPLWSRASLDRALLVPLEWAGAGGENKEESLIWNVLAPDNQMNVEPTIYCTDTMATGTTASERGWEALSDKWVVLLKKEDICLCWWSQQCTDDYI